MAEVEIIADREKARTGNSCCRICGTLRLGMVTVGRRTEVSLTFKVAFRTLEIKADTRDNRPWLSISV